MSLMYKNNIKVKWSIIILILLIIIIIVFSIFYYQADNNNKLGNIYGGLVSGFIVALIQFLMAWNDFKETEKLKSLMIKEVLITRDNSRFYHDLIIPVKKTIDIMGVTASRLMDDFANLNESAPTANKIIIEALSRGVKVRLLLPENKFLLNENDKIKADAALTKFKELKNKHNNFEYKFFEHIPAHSIFKVDNMCVVGPVFPNVPSKFTPALLIYNQSPFAEKYIEYFENEWNRSR